MAAMPRDGVRILDFTWVVAGPVATRILGDHGAQVVKVERKDPPPMGNRKLGLQCDLHRSKLSVALNMQHPRGVELARRLAAMSDIVMDNFSARVMRTWGMDYESLVAVKPDIICISMSGLGHTGPRSSYVSYGPTLQALTGYTQLMAEPDGTPAGYGYSYADMCGGYSGALAALIALWHRRRTGRGQFVDLSQFEAVASVIGPALLDISVNGRTQSPPGYNSQEGPAAPHGVYKCRPLDGDDDRWVAISVRTGTEWRRFVVAIGSPEWASEAKFRTLYMRIQNSAELDANVSRWTAEHSAEDAMAILQRAGIAAGVVENGIDLCARDPQLKERGFWPAVSTKKGPPTHVTGIPFKLSGGSGEVRTIAPEVGEDFDYVLGELLGLGKAARDELIAEGAVWP
ncbi:MAG TPA: CoA transferase [Candidatus Binatus sp.]|uniref:CaiB/BaiF CoA transferase family protein n=1 Tax=Candidatus Binatus sp. TaxID=2811406 RepID=UPI002F3E870C